MKKYKTGGWNEPIEEIEIERETAVFIFIKTPSGELRRHGKVTHYPRYYDTFEEAAAYLTERREDNVKCCKRDLRRAKRKRREFYDWLAAKGAGA